MPQYASLILDEANISRDIGSIVFDQWSALALPGNIEHPPDLNKAGEAPVSLLLSKTVMSRVINI